MKFYISFAATMLCLICHTIACAQEEGHADIFIGRPLTGNQTLIGGAFVPDELNLTERIFEGDLELDSISGNNFYTTTEPGLFNAGENSPGLLGATNPAGALPLSPAESFLVNNVTFTLNGVTSKLFYWDGVGAVHFVASPAELIITQAEEVAAGNGSIDDHPIFDIDLPSSNDLPPGGIFLAPLQMQLEGLTPSDTALVLFVTGEEFEGAVEAAELYLASRVPEPSSLAMMAFVGVALACGLRR